MGNFIPLSSFPTPLTIFTNANTQKAALTDIIVHGLISSLNIKTGKENLTEYTFGKKMAIHKFCKTCGGSVFVVAPASIFGGDGEDIFGVNVSTPYSHIPFP